MGSDAKVVQTDIQADGAVLHIIDTVLLPFYANVFSAAERAGFATLAAAVTAAGLKATLSNPALAATVFAPTELPKRRGKHCGRMA